MLNELQPPRSVRKQGERCYKYSKVRKRQRQAEAHYLMRNRRGTDDLQKANIFNVFSLQFSPTKKAVIQRWQDTRQKREKRDEGEHS